MGLLDKADEIKETEAKAPVKAKKKEKPAKPKKAKAVKPPKEPKPKKERKPKKAKRAADVNNIDPEDMDMATGLNKSLSWFVDVTVNFGLFFACIPLMMFDSSASGTPIYTWLLAAGGFTFFANTILIPSITGRTMGHFVTRINYHNSRGVKPIFIHSIFNNLLGPLALAGFFMIAFQFQDLGEGSKPMIMFITGIVFVLLYSANIFIKRASEYSQGMFDLLFGCYLVKYESTGEESDNWLFAKLENMGNFGDAWQAKIESRREKSVDDEESESDESKDDN